MKEMMKAIVCAKYGPPEVLKIMDIEKPVPRDDEILVKIRATTVTVADVRIRGFRVPTSFWLPARLALGFFRPRQPILGAEMAGVIEAIGKDVRLFKPGDEVFALGVGPKNKLDFGCYAEYKCMPEDGMVALMPKNLSFQEAAAVPVGARTALHYLRKARLEPGMSVLVYGASGSVGSYAVQLAKHFGMRVDAVCGAANAELVRALGADRVFDYGKAGFVAELESYDAALVTAGALPFRDCLRILNPGGTYLNATEPVGSLARLAASLSGRKPRIFAGKPVPREKADLLFLKDLLEAGRIKPVIDKTFPLERIAEAHRYVDGGHKKGNVAVAIEGDPL